jgi:hypothetical protein
MRDPDSRLCHHGQVLACSLPKPLRQWGSCIRTSLFSRQQQLAGGRDRPGGWQDKCFRQHTDTVLSSTGMNGKATAVLLSQVTSRAMTFLSK